MEILRCEGVRKVYGNGAADNRVIALDQIDLSVKRGEFVAIVGASGSGKSTLLHIIGSVDKPTAGRVTVEGTDLSTLNQTQAAIFRRRKVGLVYQFYNLIPTLTVYENVALVKGIAPNALDPKQMLEEVGLLDHLKNFPAQLSGGEQQRVSIARALAKNPKILLCDEPTGALDSKTGVVVLKLLLKMARDYGKTIVIVTHNQNIAKMADVVIRVRNGKIQSCEEQPNPMKAEEVDW